MTIRPQIAALGFLLLLRVCPFVPAGETAPAPPETLRILFYNTKNFRVGPDERHKSRNSMQAVADTIAHCDPHVAILAEMANAEALDSLLERMGDAGEQYAYKHIVKGPDTGRRLVMLAKFANPESRHDTTTTYNIRDLKVPVRRGFAHAVFEWNNGYRLHVLGAHLKSKVYHRLGQTDMRRYEARQLRYRVNDVLEANPEANILVLGDMNDSPQSSPIKTIIYRRFGTEKELFDLRPADSLSMMWTHYWDEEDIYARIDYAFASYFLLPEIDFATTRVPMLPYWRVASDHRPLLIAIRPSDRPAHKDLLGNFYNNFRCEYYRDRNDGDDERIAPQAR